MKKRHRIDKNNIRYAMKITGKSHDEVSRDYGMSEKFLTVKLNDSKPYEVDEWNMDKLARCIGVKPKHIVEEVTETPIAYGLDVIDDPQYAATLVSNLQNNMKVTFICKVVPADADQREALMNIAGCIEYCRTTNAKKRSPTKAMDNQFTMYDAISLLNESQATKGEETHQLCHRQIEFLDFDSSIDEDASGDHSNLERHWQTEDIFVLSPKSKGTPFVRRPLISSARNDISELLIEYQDQILQSARANMEEDLEPSEIDYLASHGVEYEVNC